ncbi:unannotated protein [freshwater metagenome]|uniref:Unannotated protein n=1 Tax=freshwater metagenome TaxID=449393 RepID=A0A6J7IM44_9ZZZZ
MSLTRVSWSLTVAACIIGAILLFISGYQGYGALSLVVGASAALNL